MYLTHLTMVSKKEEFGCIEKVDKDAGIADDENCDNDIDINDLEKSLSLNMLHPCCRLSLLSPRPRYTWFFFLPSWVPILMRVTFVIFI